MGEGNVEGVNIDHLFFFFFSANTPPQESTAVAIQPFPPDTDSDFPPIPHGTREFFSLVSSTPTLVLPELPTPYFFWCATGEATLEFGRGGKGVRQNGGKEALQKSPTWYSRSRFVLAVPESRAVTSHYIHGERLDNHLVGALLFCLI